MLNIQYDSYLIKNFYIIGIDSLTIKQYRKSFFYLSMTSVICFVYNKFYRINKIYKIIFYTIKTKVF